MIQFWKKALDKKLKNPNLTAEALASQLRFKQGDETIRFIEKHTQAILDDPKPFKLSLSSAYPVDLFPQDQIALVEKEVNAHKKILAKNLLQKIKNNRGRYSFYDLVEFSTTFVSQIADVRSEATNLQSGLDFYRRQKDNPELKGSVKNPSEMIQEWKVARQKAQKSFMLQSINHFPYIIRYPDHTALDFVDFNMKAGLPIYPLGVVDQPLYADGRFEEIGSFYFHDISHTYDPLDVVMGEVEVHHGVYGKPKIITRETVEGYFKKATQLNREMRDLVSAINELDPLNRQLMQALVFYVDHEYSPIRVGGVSHRPFYNLDELKKKLLENFSEKGTNVTTMIRRLGSDLDFGASFKAFPDFKITPELLHKKTEQYVELIHQVQAKSSTSRSSYRCNLNGLLSSIKGM